MPKPDALPETAKRDRTVTEGRCVCGEVRVEIVVPAVWAWHDHSAASRHAQGCAYATYIGSWKSRFRILAGEDRLSRFEDPETGTARSFCSRCGTPVLYERPRAPKMVNISRSLFAERTGREPRYHMFLGEAPDWTYLGEPLIPLKGYPGVMYERPKRNKKRPTPDPMF
ncbi:MAG TPA: GFA family protein [Caulobacteraceae bacterium]|jgi:hypothetical protein